MEECQVPETGWLKNIQIKAGGGIKTIEPCSCPENAAGCFVSKGDTIGCRMCPACGGVYPISMQDLKPCLFCVEFHSGILRALHEFYDWFYFQLPSGFRTYVFGHPHYWWFGVNWKGKIWK